MIIGNYSIDIATTQKLPMMAVLVTNLAAKVLNIRGASHICKNTSSGSFFLPSDSFLLAPGSWLLTPISSLAAKLRCSQHKPPVEPNFWVWENDMLVMTY
jgi:hypothetical protein